MSAPRQITESYVLFFSTSDCKFAVVFTYDPNHIGGIVLSTEMRKVKRFEEYFPSGESDVATDYVLVETEDISSAETCGLPTHWHLYVQGDFPGLRDFSKVYKVSVVYEPIESAPIGIMSGHHCPPLYCYTCGKNDLRKRKIYAKFPVNREQGSRSTHEVTAELHYTGPLEVDGKRFLINTSQAFREMILRESVGT